MGRGDIAEVKTSYSIKVNISEKERERENDPEETHLLGRWSSWPLEELSISNLGTCLHLFSDQVVYYKVSILDPKLCLLQIQIPSESNLGSRSDVGCVYLENTIGSPNRGDLG
jgi:hypothetical protein